MRVLRALVTVALFGGALGCGYGAWQTSTHLPEVRAGGPVTISAHRGDVLALTRLDGPGRTARCTLRPVAAEARTVQVGVGPGIGPGLEVEVWWDGRAELTCDRAVTGSIRPRGAGNRFVGFLVGTVVLWCLGCVSAMWIRRR